MDPHRCAETAPADQAAAPTGQPDEPRTAPDAGTAPDTGPRPARASGARRTPASVLRRAVVDSSVTAWTAGLISILISFAGPLLMVLEAARLGGLTPEQTSSWVWSLCIGSGLATLTLSLTQRQPVILAWSIPGSVLLASALPHHAFSDVLGTYIAVGIALALLGLSRWFSRAVLSVPTPIAAGILAGILLPFILDAARSGLTVPLITVAMLVAYVAGRHLLPRYAVPITMAVGLAMVPLTGALGNGDSAVTAPQGILATPVWTTPTFDAGLMLSLGVPMLLVAIAGQNLPGITLMTSLGYRFDPRPAQTTGGLLSIALAPLGGHTFNLATVTAAVCAGPEAHPARRRRYMAGVAAGVLYLTAGVLANGFLLLVSLIPQAALTVLAGLALLSGLQGALTDLTQPGTRGHPTAAREAGILALVITASGIDALGLSAPGWGALIAVAVYLVRRRQRARP